MDPTVSILVSKAKAAQLNQYLAALAIDGEPIRVSVRDGTLFDLWLGQANLDPAPDLVTLNGAPVQFDDLGFALVEIEDEAGSSGSHVPEGILFIYDPLESSVKSIRPAKDGIRPIISTTDVAPAILANFGLAIPDYMNRPGAIRL